MRCWPGLAPAGDLLFFAPPKKSRQKKGGPTGCVPQRCCGQPAVLAGGVRRGTRFVRFAHAAQTTAASQITLRVHASLHPLTPPAALLGASRGEGATARAIAALGPLLPSPRSSEAERSDGPRVFGIPSGRAEKRRAWGGPGSAACPASCSDSLRLSERSAASAQRVPQRRPATEHRRLPRSEAQGTRPVGSLFLCLLSFGETKESRCAAGRTSRPAAHPNPRRLLPNP